MTCIIGMEQDDAIYIGSDSALSDSWTISSLSAQEKIFENHDMIFGVCGSMRVAQLMKHGLILPEHNTENQTDMQYLVIEFIDELRNFLKKKGTLYSSDDKIQYLPESALIVGYKNRLYVVDEDFQVSRTVGGFCCEGSGREVATGAMQILKDRNDMTPEEKITKALEASAIHTCFVQGPFHIIKYEHEKNE